MKNSLFLGICLLCCSCKQQHSLNEQPAEMQNDTLTGYAVKDGIIHVDFDRPVSPSVFDFFQSVELIPLETTEKSIVGWIAKMLYHDERYYLLDRQQHIVHVFDENGKFVFKIDRRGQGPGEYPFLDDIYIHPYTGSLQLLCAMGFVYDCDLKGNFQKMYRVTDAHLRAVHGMVALNKSATVFYARFEPHKIFYYDMKNGKIIHKEFEEERHLGSFMAHSFYVCRNKIYFYRPFDRRVFTVGKDSLEGAYAWDFGRYNRKEIVLSQAAQRNNPSLLVEEVNAHFPCQIFMLGENSRYVIAQIILKGSIANLIYDKSTQTCSFIPRFAESVYLFPYIITDHFVLSYCNPGELEQYVTENMLDESNRKLYNELIHSTESNPIIIKYRFKQTGQ